MFFVYNSGELFSNKCLLEHCVLPQLIIHLSVKLTMSQALQWRMVVVHESFWAACGQWVNGVLAMKTNIFCRYQFQFITQLEMTYIFKQNTRITVAQLANLPS